MNRHIPCSACCLLAVNFQQSSTPFNFQYTWLHWLHWLEDLAIRKILIVNYLSNRTWLLWCSFDCLVITSDGFFACHSVVSLSHSVTRYVQMWWVCARPVSKAALLAFSSLFWQEEEQDWGIGWSANYTFQALSKVFFIELLGASLRCQQMILSWSIPHLNIHCKGIRVWRTCWNSNTTRCNEWGSSWDGNILFRCLWVWHYNPHIGR